MSEVATVPNSANRHDPVKAREALAAKFATPEEKREFYRAIGARGNAGRLTLPAEDAAALRAVFQLISQIAQKHGFDLASPEKGVGDV